MSRRMEMTELRLIHLDPAIAQKEARSVIAAQITSHAAFTLTEAEIEDATFQRLLKLCRRHIDTAERGTAIKGLAFTESNDEAGSRLAIMLTNGYVLLTPPKRERGIA
ncbi:hypothetical protein C7401_1377 [Paraburkholderia unamae]|uniref:hypothetical protein n=1 Tax=Paraburkholderia unamae TaxID=219649 RepID=UPI000DC49A13|nr:hypothetical protein [Paraburkholderia unamae]RAR51467.1 hypothetical protein C7401_1377 [Paraburkholderia unamae]